MDCGTLVSMEKDWNPWGEKSSIIEVHLGQVVIFLISFFNDHNLCDGGWS